MTLLSGEVKFQFRILIFITFIRSRFLQKIKPWEINADKQVLILEKYELLIKI